MPTGDALGEGTHAELMAQLGVDTDYDVPVVDPWRRSEITRKKQGFEYGVANRMEDATQAVIGDEVEAAQESIHGGYEFAVFSLAQAAALTGNENAQGFSDYMAEQVHGTWTDAETSSIGSTTGKSFRASTWQPGQSIMGELAMVGIELIPAAKPLAAGKGLLLKQGRKGLASSSAATGTRVVGNVEARADSVGAARVHGTANASETVSSARKLERADDLPHPMAEAGSSTRRGSLDRPGESSDAPSGRIDESDSSPVPEIVADNEQTARLSGNTITTPRLEGPRNRLVLDNDVGIDPESREFLNSMLRDPDGFRGFRNIEARTIDRSAEDFRDFPFLKEDPLFEDIDRVKPRTRREKVGEAVRAFFEVFKNTPGASE